MKTPKHPGPYHKSSMPQTIKAFAKINGKDVLPEIALPRAKRQGKPRAVETKPRSTLHKELLKDVDTHLALHGWWVKNMEVKATFYQGHFMNPAGNRKGILDRMACRDNRKIWYDAKMEGDTWRPEQKEFIRWMETTGDECYQIGKIEDIYPICGCAGELERLS